MVWQKRCKSLSFNCTWKRKKPGTGGPMAHFIDAIAHGKGDVFYQQYLERFTGIYWFYLGTLS